jgi:hypothetical protein
MYEARITTNAISALARRRQLEATKIALDCVRRRRAGGSESECLARADRVTSRNPGYLPLQRARANYFIARCLRDRDPARARVYYRQALQAWPLHIRSWLGLALG